MLIVLFYCSTAFGQIEVKNNQIVISVETFKEITTELSNYFSLKQTVKQKDLEIQQLNYKIELMDSVKVNYLKQIDLLTKQLEEIKPTLWDQMQKYGFIIGLIVGVFISK